MFKLPARWEWLRDFDDLARLADQFEGHADTATKPKVATFGLAGLGDLLGDPDLGRLAASSPAIAAAMQPLRIFSTPWDREAHIAHDDIMEAARALRVQSSAVARSKTDSERRAAMLYQLAMLHIRAPRTTLVEQGIAIDFGEDSRVVEGWIRWARERGLIRQASSGGPRTFVIEPSGLDYLESLFSIEAAPPAATREKHAKFGILDAEKLLDADLAAAAGAFGPALIFFDLDKFKDLNERFLETRVDAEILPELSQRIRDCVVGNGYAYSVGGDEFIVLLPNASSAMAQALAEAMRSVIRGRPFRCQGEEATITASFGVASAGQVSRSELRVAANEAKRLAKHGGRDRVVMYSSPTPAPLS